MAELSRDQERQRRVAPLRHGRFSRSDDGHRLIARKVAYRRRKLVGTLPDYDPARDGSAVRAWAQLDYVADQLFAALAAGGVLNDEERPRRLTTELRQARATQLAIELDLRGRAGGQDPDPVEAILRAAQGDRDGSGAAGGPAGQESGPGAVRARHGANGRRPRKEES